ncbi:MAG TPA: hypothetical protein DCL21_06575 [Alphaproteobacteria bacterium]|nr:hypothetical protein [Alphaproteobacteria bacterium]
MLRFYFLTIWTKLLGLFINKQDVYDALLFENKSYDTFRTYYKTSKLSIITKTEIITDQNIEKKGVHYGVGMFGYVISLPDFIKYIEKNGKTLGLFVGSEVDYYGSFLEVVNLNECDDSGVDPKKPYKTYLKEAEEAKA